MSRSGSISIAPGSPGAIKQALNASGWLDEEVIAAGQLRQGKPMTVVEGEVDGDLRVAVAGGVLTAWRLRPTWQINGPALDRLAADVAEIVRRRGLNPVGPPVPTGSTEG